MKLAHVDIGPNRFPFSAQNRYLNINGFAYPAAYTDRHTRPQHARGARHDVAADFGVRRRGRIWETLRFTLRCDVNNIYKYHNFNPPNSTYNKTDPSGFGTFTGTRGSFSDIGTGRWHAIMVFRLEW